MAAAIEPTKKQAAKPRAAAGRTGKLTLTTPSDREIVMTRVFDAPRNLVWQAWTDPKHVPQWWGPRGWSLSACEIDLRPGGSYRYVMRSPNGADHPMKGAYREVVPTSRIVYTDQFDEPGMPPMESVITMVLEERSGKTTLTATAVYESKQVRDAILKMGVEDGTNETWDRLDEKLAAMQDDKAQIGDTITITRVLDAPRELVFKAWTEPEHLVH